MVTGHRDEVVDLRDAPERRRLAGGFTCPHCGGSDFEAVTDGEDVNFLCLGCGLCWHVELGYVSRVDPDTCPGCRRRTDCLARWRAG